jgi:hypothetical protein
MVTVAFEENVGGPVVVETTVVVGTDVVELECADGVPLAQAAQRIATRLRTPGSSQLLLSATAARR